MNDTDTVFTLTIEDIQMVVLEQLCRRLTQKEIEIFKNHIDDYLPWWEPSINCIERVVTQKG